MKTSGNPITEEELRKRLKHKESGALIPQIFVTIAVCFGSFSFGNILGWGGPAIHHLDELEYDILQPDASYAWITSLAPLGATLGILPCAFITRRMGPKRTMLFQAPFLLLGWFLIAYYNKFNIYCFGHFVCAFFAISYIYAGEAFLTATIHRNNMREVYACFRSCVILGILSMNIISTFFERLWLCVICASMTLICCTITYFLPDSPFYLMKNSEFAAENSLKYYTGKTSVVPELNVIRQHVTFLSFGEQSYKDMLSAKVVIKTVLIITTLQIIKTMTGYYAFVLDSVRIFTRTLSIINPYVDNIIFGVVLCVARFIGTELHLHITCGIKKPMAVSCLLMSIVLAGLGIINYMDKELKTNHLQWILLVGLSLFAVSYEVGMDLCPEMALYDYIPYQIYDYLMKLMLVVHWFLVFVTVRLYAACHIHFGQQVAMWVLAVIAFLGFIFIGIYVVESKGKTLMAIQMELGGNPVGSRGSRRQRIANPLEDYAGFDNLRDIIATHQSASATSYNETK